MQPLIEVAGLSFRYGDGTAALRGVDFQLHPGETVALFGANGSGKTTFVLHLNGLLTGDGRVVVCGMPVIVKNLPQIRRKVGIVFQEPDEQLFMPTVLEDVAFGPLNMGLDLRLAQERANRALAETGDGARARQSALPSERRRKEAGGALPASLRWIRRF